MKRAGIYVDTDRSSDSARGILKTEVSPLSNIEKHNNLSVTWDEEGIAAHDLTRGTRMKIEEPKTPYHRGRISENEEDRVAALEDTLEQVAKRLKVESAIQSQLLHEAGVAENEQSDLATATYGCRIASLANEAVTDDDDTNEHREDVNSHESDTDTDEPSDSEEQKKPSDAFEAKRRMHYGNVGMMLRWHPTDSDEEDDESEGDDDAAASDQQSEEN